jgi:DnaJ-class molecular chaperone
MQSERPNKAQQVRGGGHPVSCRQCGGTGKITQKDGGAKRCPACLGRGVSGYQTK